MNVEHVMTPYGWAILVSDENSGEIYTRREFVDLILAGGADGLTRVESENVPNGYSSKEDERIADQLPGRAPEAKEEKTERLKGLIYIFTEEMRHRP